MAFQYEPVPTSSTYGYTGLPHAFFCCRSFSQHVRCSAEIKDVDEYVLIMQMFETTKLTPNGKPLSTTID